MDFEVLYHRVLFNFDLRIAFDQFHHVYNLNRRHRAGVQAVATAACANAAGAAQPGAQTDQRAAGARQGAAALLQELHEHLPRERAAGA